MITNSKMATKPLMIYNAIPNLIANEYGINLKGAACRSYNDLIRTRYELASDLYKKDLYSHFGCVNAIEFSGNGLYLVSGGDDRRVLLWNVEKALSGVGQPMIMKGEHTSNIFCLGFDSDNSKLFSGGNDEQVIIHDVRTGEALDVILHEEAIYCLSVDPFNDNIFATACDDGRIFIWDIREPSSRDPSIVIRSRSAFHAVMHNPVESRLVVTANSKEGISLWDIRHPRHSLIQYNGGLVSSQGAMSVRFNSKGTQILGLRRRMPPILYNVSSPHPLAEFDHKGYYNSCTMKSCCFAGTEDQYILSGSDDFMLYMWKIPNELSYYDVSSTTMKWVNEAHLILYGHRSIVNQVRYNYSNSIIASSGVEKLIKIWSVFPIPDGSGNAENESNTAIENRKVYSHEEYINLILESGQLMAHDYSHQSCQEDPRMMAFFDSLVQRDIEGWTTDSSDDGNSLSIIDLRYSNRRVDQLSDSSSTSSSDNESSEPLNMLNSQTVSYIQSLGNRMEASVNTLCKSDSSVPNSFSDDNQPSTSGNVTNSAKGASTSFASTSSTSYSERPKSKYSSEMNKISLLINEKKKDQLRKVAKCALRTTKYRLKKLRRSYQKFLKKRYDDGDEDEEDEDDDQKEHKYFKDSKDQKEDKKKKNDNNLSNIQTQLEGVLTLLEGLSNKVDNGLKNGRKQDQKLGRRLRYLTNQSDYILNEELPLRQIVSDSPLLSDDEEFVGFINGERTGRLLNTVVSDDDSSSLTSLSDSNDLNFSSEKSDSSDADLLLPNVTPSSLSIDPENNSEDDDDDDDDDENENDNNDHNLNTSNNNLSRTKPLVKIDLSEELKESDTDESETELADKSNCNKSSLDKSSSDKPSDKSCENILNNCTFQSGPVIQCPYLLNICHSSPSASCGNCQESSSSSQITFKSVNHTNRSYRKRKFVEDSSEGSSLSKDKVHKTQRPLED